MNLDDLKDGGEEEHEEKDDEPIEDLLEALALLNSCLTELESLVKLDNRKKFMTVARRAKIMDLAGEALTFVDQWDFREE